MIRQFLSYLPSSVDEMAPRGETADPVDRREEALATIVPREPRRVHNAKRLIELVVDAGSFFPIAPLYGRARITGLARINGYPIGVMANDPMHNGGATDVAAGLKAARLTQLCDLFHLPLVDFADEPGLMVGLESEKQGIERAGARLVCITNACRMPWITIVDPPPVRRRWPDPPPGDGDVPPLRVAERTLGIDAHRRRGGRRVSPRDRERADDPEVKLREIEERLDRLGVAVPHRRGDRPGHHRPARHPAADRRLRRGRAARAGAADGPAAAALPAVRGLRVVDLSRTPVVCRPCSGLGQDNTAVLGEYLGLDATEVAALAAAGVISDHPPG